MRITPAPLALDVQDGDLLGLLHDQRDHALALLGELRQERDRVRRTTAVVEFIASTFAGLAFGVVVGSLVLATFAPFEPPSRPTLSTLWGRTG